MADIRPFSCIRPKKELAKRIAALPYDVFSREEALYEVEKEPLSFLKIDRAETQFDNTVSMYDDRVYDKAKELLNDMIQKEILIEDNEECYYIYELIMEGRHQTGIVAVASIDDYINHKIKTHEDTREDKELDRIKHVDICNAQTGPIFLTYRHEQAIHDLINEGKKNEALYSFEASDNVIHNVWKISDKDVISKLKEAFSKINNIYIADGHHRAASAVKVGLIRREKDQKNEKSEVKAFNKNSKNIIECKNDNINNRKNNGINSFKNDYNDDNIKEFDNLKSTEYQVQSQGVIKKYNYFLSVLFPDDELKIYPYFRVVKDINGHTVDSFLNEISKVFDIERIYKESFLPDHKMIFGMLLENKWYKLTLKAKVEDNRKKSFAYEPEKLLDVAILQDYILKPVLMINDPRTDKRIDFVGGIRGVRELVNRTNNDMKVAFTLCPTSIEELFAVSDLDKRMPPKSTWFEPKLRSGLFIHSID